MERTKEILAVAPFAAILIAISYLHGYWGKFEILAFPYLSFQELITYSTAPFFGFILTSIFGMFLGAVGYNSDEVSTSSKWRTNIERLFFIILIFSVIYLGWPEKWLFLPVPFVFVAGYIIRTYRHNSSLQKYKAMILPLICIIFLLVGSFGYGRTQAERLMLDTKPNIELTLNTGVESGKLIGKLGTYYFFLNNLNNLVIIPESSIVRIRYTKAHYLKPPRFNPIVNQ